MKKFFLIIFLFSFNFSYAKAKFTVVTTFTIIQDMAKNVAGDAADVFSITKPGAEIHGYQPTPMDIVKSQKADLILWNGMNLERWFKRFFKNMKSIDSVVLTDGIKPISIYGGSYDGKPNPHAWMSTENALIYVENIRKAFVKYDPKNSNIYNRNAKQYSEKIKKLGLSIKKSLAKINKNKLWLVSSEGAFSYLARDYNLKELYLWPINADQQGSPRQVKDLINKIRENNISVVFSESTISDKPIKQVAKETGAAYGGVLYVDSLSNKSGKVPTYLDLILVTTQTIIKGLQ